MGANTFFTFAHGEGAQAAFEQAVAAAKHYFGHAGYTGTIGEKVSFVDIGSVATEQEAYDLAHELINNGDARVDDKWGPAGCIIIETRYLFFGWASN